MQYACMNKHIHIRDFDGDLHAKLVNKATRKGVSLSQFLRTEMAEIANRPTIEDVIEQLRNLPRGDIKLKLGRNAEIIRDLREERVNYLAQGAMERLNASK